MPTKKRRTMRRNKMVRRTKTRNKRYRGGNKEKELAQKGANLFSEFETINDRLQAGVIDEEEAEKQRKNVKDKLRTVKLMDHFGEGVLPTGKSMYRTG